MSAPGASPETLLHRVLMGLNRLESMPSWMVFLLLAGLAAGVGQAWNDEALWVTATWLTFALLDWALLAALPQTRRSFGPIKPPLLALAVVRALVAILLARLGSFWLFLGSAGAVSILSWYSLWVEPLDIQVSQKGLALEKWPADVPPLRLLHLSDLHLERTGLREERLDQLVDSLAPDLICFSGDLLNLSYTTDPIAISQVRHLISRWNAPLGVFVVTGSPLVDLPDIAPIVLKDLPHIEWLQDKIVTLDFYGHPLTILGFGCSHDPNKDAPRLRTLMAQVPPESPVILVYHTPDLAPESAEAGVDLQLSGHTHGGQIRLPIFGALVTSSIYGKRFEMGEYHLPRNGREPMTLYVSRGIGVEGGSAPRARFLCRPEITLWTLTGSRPIP